MLFAVTTRRKKEPPIRGQLTGQSIIAETPAAKFRRQSSNCSNWRPSASRITAFAYGAFIDAW
jgi:hypothetical protein